MFNNVRTLLGAGGFGGSLNYKDSEFVVKSFFKQKTGKYAELDTAFMYAAGKSEEIIGKMNLRLNENVQIATKANPWDNKLLDAAGVRMQLETSLKRLQLDNVHLFYLHAPDHKTPITETLKAVNDLYNEKKFKEFGLSNYAAWEVAEICTICKNNGWVQPTVYQGMYNALTRNVEKELFKCLRYFNIRFYAYNPLAGGMLTGKHKIEDANKNEPGRFFGKGWAEVYRKRYWRADVFECIEKLKKGLHEVYGDEVNVTEASFRWLCHHSKLDGSYGDGVIIGISSIEHFNENMCYIGKGPLDEKVVKVFEECWEHSLYCCSDYFR